MISRAWKWLSANATPLGAVATLVGIVTAVGGGAAWVYERALGDAGSSLEAAPAEAVVTMSLAEYEARQREIEARIREDLAAAGPGDAARVEAELAEALRRLGDSDAALAEARARLADLVGRIEALERQGAADPTEAGRAIDGLRRGDTAPAEAVLDALEVGASPAGVRAEAAVARGRLAEHDLRWDVALDAYERALALSPDEETRAALEGFVARTGLVASPNDDSASLVEPSGGLKTTLLPAPPRVCPEGPDGAPGLSAGSSCSPESGNVSGGLSQADVDLAVASDFIEAERRPDRSVDAERVAEKIEALNGNQASSILRAAARTLEADGQIDAAILLFERSLALETGPQGEWTDPALKDLDAIAFLRASEGDLEAGLDLYTELVERAGERGSTLIHAYAHQNRAVLLEQLARSADASEAMEMAVAVLERALGPDDPETLAMKGRREALLEGLR